MTRIWIAGLCAVALFPLTAGTGVQQPKPQVPPQKTQVEVELETKKGGRLGLAIAPPALAGLGEDLVAKDFKAPLNRDLEEAGPFALITGVVPGSTDAASYPAWARLATDWLLASKVEKGAGDEVSVEIQVVDVKAGKPVFSKRYIGRDSQLRRIAHTISDDLVARLTGEKGVASTRVIFVRQTAPGVKEIFQVDRDGAGLLQLTRWGSLTLSPTVAPDGRLAYITYKGGTPEIWGERKRGQAHSKLYPTTVSPQGHCYSPIWSPDGKRIAFVQGDRRGNSDIMILDVDSGRVKRLTDGGCINTEPSWNPNGTQVAFTSDREGGPQVYLMEEDGSNVRRLTFEGNYNASASWSPNGAMVAYVSRFEGKFDLFVHKLGEGKAYQITTGIFSSEGPAWSPDERRLVFASTRSGNMQLWTTDLSGKSLSKLTELTGCQSPRWTRSR
ncbi:MAG: PD40 domain-containing protein [Holophagaceae bacterium]|nr:PD40 domain-containing protein [Holophagaceae bacterium]